MAHTLLQTYS